MEFLRAIGPVFNFLLLAGALFFLTRKRIRKLFRDRKERIAEALGRAADAQDQARHTAEDIAEAQQAADAQAQCQLADAQRQAAANTAAADAETARQAEAVRRSAQQTEAQLRSDMEDRVSDAAIGRITAAAAGVLAQDAFAPARANLVDDFLAHIGEHLTTQPSDALALAETGTLTVTVESAEPLSAAALDALTGTLTRAYGHVTVMTTVRPELIGGVCLRIGDTHYDGTLRHALDLLEQDAANSVLHTTQETPDLADCIRAKLADTHVGIDVFQSGVVTSLSDGICRIRGLADAMAGELLAFDGTLRGMVMDLGREDIGVVLLGPYGHLQEGDRVRRTGQIMSVPVGEEMTGRVVDALGRPIDGLGPIRTTERRAIESPAPGVIARKGVSVPLQTGIKAIDALVPIGRGQRELIIGDRKTGKTAIAIDAILNQRGKGMVCIYVAIGQKASTVANIRETLAQHGALDYTIIVSATAADSAPMQYIAPMAGAAIGEFFMYNGEDGKPASETNPGGHVLVIYDDLSKQAVAYRQMSLTLHRPPGREAYPGDIFYLHSRLLERAVKMSKKNGYGSMTALPIIETQDGDVSAYIPTNVISITDGQIYLQSELFFQGQRPAVDVGISVSRVGGDAQTKAMKQVAGNLRLDLASYQELAGFTQFGSDLDEATQKQLTHGARMTELLKQPRYKPFEVGEQIVTLFAGNEGFLDDLEIADVLPFRAELIEYMDNGFGSLLDKVRAKKIDDDTKAELLRVIGDFKQQFMAKHHSDVSGSEEN